MAAKVAHPLRYGSSGRYSYRVFLWLPKYSYSVFLWCQKVAPPQVTDPVDGIPVEYSYGWQIILIEYSYGCPGSPPPQVADPMDGIPIEYSYGCPGRGARSHVPCLGLTSFIYYPNASCKALRLGLTLI